MNPYVLTGLLLIVPGTVLLAVGFFGEKFYSEKEWSGWPMEAGIVGGLISLAHNRFGKKGSRFLLLGLAIGLILLGMWIISEG